MTDTLSYYATLDSLGYYVTDDSLYDYIGTIIQPFDSALYQIAELRESEFIGGELIVYDGATLNWVAKGGAEARSTLGLGDMSIQEPDSVDITGGTIVGIEDIAVEDGGTGASDSEIARENLGLKIDEDVQAFSSELQQIAALQHSGNQNIKEIMVSNGYFWNARTADSARADLGLAIGSAEYPGDVQAWSLALQDYADGEDIPASNVENGQYFIDGSGLNGQFWASDGEEAGIWRTFSRHFSNCLLYTSPSPRDRG